MRDADERIAETLAGLPNPPDESAPDEDAVLREVGDGGRLRAQTTWTCSAT